MADVGGFILPHLERLKLEETECDGTACYRISAHHPYGDLYKVDISCDDLLIRRVNEPDSDGVASDEIRREIRVDEPIDEQDFQFRPMT